jgi:drug/metabolite transporter (DMT)-like permease
VTEPSNAGGTDDERRALGLPPEPRLPGEVHDYHPPTPVRVSFWLFLAAGVLFVGGYALTLLTKRQFVDAVVRATNDPRIPREQIESGVTVLLWLLVTGAVVFAVLFALFAYKAQEGTRSARSILTVLTVLTLVFQLVLRFGSPITLLGTVVALVALGLMFLPSVTGYFPKIPRKLP